MATLIGKETASNSRYSQVYQATHGGDDIRLPYMRRSFISFTYGGKFIEDFNLIATIDGSRMEREGYSSFNDITTSYDNLDGQQYWGTHYKTNTIDFKLATDGIDQKKLDEFLYWFSAGVCRELILSEHPNRAQLARVAAPPKLHLLPFEEDAEITILKSTYTTKTTLYKGEIDLSLVMDSPHWYSVMNILGKIDGDHFRDVWDEFTRNGTREVNIFNSPDALKIVYEDNIPLGSMIQKDMLFGNGTFASVETLIISCICDNSVTRISTNPGNGARIDPGNGTFGVISGALISTGAQGVLSSLAKNDSGHFYYAGTAPAPTIIRFILTPQFDNSTGYIVTPYNSHTTIKYNTITIEGIRKQELKFTTPNVYSSYNKAIEIFRNAPDTWSEEDLKQHLRDEIRHKEVREWAIIAAGESSKNARLSKMRNFFAADGNANLDAKFEFNSENGQALGTFWYKVNNNLTEVTEDVGDMLRSNNLIIRERNHPTTDGYITSWVSTNDNTKTYSHRIYHNVPNGLKNIALEYKNMYL